MTNTPALSLPDDEDDLDQTLAQLPTWQLSLWASRIDAVLESRNAVALPGLVLDAIREVVAAEQAEIGLVVPLTVQPAPTSITFTTTSDHDNGIFWDESDPVVTFADGTTRTLDLDECGDLRDALSDHAEWVEPQSDSTLRVTFTPPALYVSH